MKQKTLIVKSEIPVLQSLPPRRRGVGRMSIHCHGHATRTQVEPQSLGTGFQPHDHAIFILHLDTAHAAAQRDGSIQCGVGAGEFRDIL